MKKNIGIFLLLILFGNCNPFSDKIPVKKFVKSIDQVIFFPSNFNESSSVDFLFKLFEAEIDKQLIYSIEDDFFGYTRTALSERNYTLFYDSTNVLNSILIFNVDEHIPLSSYLGSNYLKEIQNTLYTTWGRRGIFYDKINSLFYKKGTLEYIKIKYKKTINKDNMYFTQYIINNYDKTFCVIVNSNNEEDYEDLIKKIKLRLTLD